MKDGNLTYDGTYKYTYDHQNRLVKATRADTDVVIQTASFDGLGRRIKKIVTNSGDLDAATVYHHDGNQIIETRDGSNNVTMQVYHGTQYIDEILGMRLQHGRVYAHQAEGDQSGSLKDWNVTGLTDLTGRLLERTYYSPYGEPEIVVETHFFDYDDDGDVDDDDIAAGTSTGVCWGSYSGDCKRLDADADRDIDAADYAAIAAFADALSSDGQIQRVPAAPGSRLGNPLGHQGLVFDAEIGSYQNRARQYAPGAKRFMQRDPLALGADDSVAYRDGMNLYQYVGACPTGTVDPSGLYLVRYCGRGTCHCPQVLQDQGAPATVPNVRVYSVLNLWACGFTSSARSMWLRGTCCQIHDGDVIGDCDLGSTPPHECVHICQIAARPYGYIGFAIGYILEWVAGGFDYWGHPYEVGARREADEARFRWSEQAGCGPPV